MKKSPTFCILFMLLLLCSLVLTPIAATLKSGALAIDTQQHMIYNTAGGTVAQPPSVSAASYALFDPVGGVFVASKDADTRRPMASTTKIMTALLILESCRLEDSVTIPAQAVGIEGSSIYLYEGETLSVQTLLYALLLSSANDAAVALAIHASGSIAAFAERMNQKAQELGLENTHFCNPHGLHDKQHYTTASDLARLAAAAMQNAEFAKIAATKRYAVPTEEGTGRLFVNHNRLLRTLDGAVGVKTGFTHAGGRCLVSAARRNGLFLIAVTLNAPNDWQDHTALLEWGFTARCTFSPTPPSVVLPVVGGTEGSVTLLPQQIPQMTVPTDHPPITCTVEAPRFLFAGFAQGTPHGRIVYRMGDSVLCELTLVTDRDIHAAKQTTRLRQFIQNLFQR